MQVEVGQIVNTHGIKGEVKVKSNSDFTDTRFQPGEVLIVNHHHNEIEMTITSYRIHKDFTCLNLKVLIILMTSNNIKATTYSKNAS